MHYQLKDMQTILQEAEISLDYKAISLLWRYHQLLRDANSKLNLTRIHNFENMVRKHYIDSLYVHKIINEKGITLSSPFIDIGSGGGLPGIPLAIRFPKLQFILAESRQVRCLFLEKVVHELALKNVVVHNHRISSNNCPQIRGAITRALELMSSTLLRLSDNLDPSGIVIFMKGPNCDDEIKDSTEIIERENYAFKLILNHHYNLPNSEDERRLVIWEKEEKRVRIPDKNKQYIDNGEYNKSIITSPSNPHYKLIYSLRQSRYIKKQGQSLVCGNKLVSEMLLRFPEYASALICPPEYKNMTAIIKKNKHIERFTFSRTLFKELDFMGTASPMLLINIKALEKWNIEVLDSKDYNSSKKQRSIYVFLPLGNPENLGAAIRNCVAFQVDAVILLKEACHPFHPKAIRVAATSCFDIPIYEGPSMNELNDFLANYKNSEHFLYGLDLRDNADNLLDSQNRIAKKFTNIEEIENIRGIDLDNYPFGLVLGSEGQGLSANIHCHRLYIPIAEELESLNASVSLGIALYVISKKLKLR